MAITKMSNSGIASTGSEKYNDMLAGNPPFIPNSFESIATFTATGGETTFTFTSIPQTYKTLHIRLFTKDTSTGANGGMLLPMRPNGNTTGANYANHSIRADGSNVTLEGNSGSGYVYLYEATNRTTSGATLFNAGYINIIDYASTTKTKTIASFFGGDNNAVSTDFRVAFNSHLWNDTTAITSIKFDANISGFYANSMIALYGIKG
jgi:hypothetical protein